MPSLAVDTEYPQFEEADCSSLRKVLARVIKYNFKALEFGCWTGCSSIVIAEQCKLNNGELTCVDTFQGSVETRLVGLAKQQDINTMFWQNVNFANVGDTIGVKRGDSIKICKTLSNNFYDFIFIDDDHRYDHVKALLEEAYKKLRPGGIICGHDLDCRYDEIPFTITDNMLEIDTIYNVHVGVSKAVAEFFDNKYFIDGKLWWSTK